MSSGSVSSSFFVFLSLLAALPGGAQQPAPQQAPPPPAVPAPPKGPVTGPSAPPTAPEAAPVKKSGDPYTIEDGGFSVQLNYWLTQSEPILRGGKATTVRAPESPDFDFPGKGKPTPEVMISFPAGREHTMRISYLRTQSSGDATAPRDLALFSVGYKQGDRLAARYRLEHAKASWDYLSYTFAASQIRVKTLWEVQYAAIKTTIDAPIRAATSTDAVFAEGNKYVILPALGLGLEQAVGKRFRWEAKGSGFGLPKRSGIWNAEASAVVNMRRFELLVGAKALWIKTSPKDDSFFKQTHWGPYVGLRWYFEPNKR